MFTTIFSLKSLDDPKHHREDEVKRLQNLRTYALVFLAPEGIQIAEGAVK